MFLSYLFLAAVLVLVFWMKSQYPKWRGRAGENFVSRKLSRLDPEHFNVIDNLLLPSTGNTVTTQLDHVVVSDYGIFCVETKSYDGWIFGSANQRYWTQQIYRHKERFYNPLYQNFAHRKAVEALVKPIYPAVPVVGFVAFPYAGKLKISGTDCVGYARDVVSKISEYTRPVISAADRARICEVLARANIQDKESLRLHNQEIRELTKAR
ncbi:MAG: nuclease-related domain-containing protein [Bryobacteraceae bacterium]